MAALVLVLGITARAEAPSWIEWLPSSSPALSVLYRMVPSLEGPVNVRRPPKQTAPQLAILSSRSPSDADLIKITAREFEAALDFTNAEARWKLLDSVSPDHVTNQIDLADYYHRRMEPEQELEALKAAEDQSPRTDAPLEPDEQQRAWKLHLRAQQLIQAEALPADLAIQDYERWIQKYPKVSSVQRQFFEYLLSHGRIARAEQVFDQYRQNFPDDRVAIVRARMELAEKRGSPGAAIAVYDSAYDPLWPQELIDGYFKRLADSHRSFEFYQNARRTAISKPLALEPATRLFHYYRAQGDVSSAKRELAEFRIRKETAKATWTPVELRTLAKLCASVDEYEETIRYSYALYSLKGADVASVEDALAQIIDALLKAPDQPIRFGRGDLSFYHDIATMDSSPGFLNGILSLVFNSQYPNEQFRSEQGKSVAYFHRAKAAELYALLSQRFPNSPRRSELLSRLIESYALYGEDEAIIRQGTAFITNFPNAEQRTKVALEIADAYARGKRTADELAVYDRLLAELAAKAQQVPLGEGQPRSPEYSQVFERYVSRLGQLNRIPDALALHRREIDRNPNDPGLYEMLVSYLGAHQRAPEIEQVYRRALQRFPDPSWRHKLARYYLRTRMSGELQTLSQEVVDTFSGSDVESYIADVGQDPALERRLQVDINVYALSRFPHDLRFVNNLITLYSSPATANSAALMRLLGEHWYDDEGIRRMYFERLAAAGSLASVVQNAASLLPPTSAGSWPSAEAANPVLTRFIGEAAAWQSHFETAATILQAVAAAYPSDASFSGRASELYRSLAAYDSSYTSTAVSIARDLYRSEPRNRERLTRIGEIYADHDMAGPAATVWSRIPTIEPGKSDSYLETATVFWDYLDPSDALTWLERGRTQLKDARLWAYETGAILESQGRRQEAVAEYVKGALGPNTGSSQSRLVKLAAREGYKALVDDQTKRLMETSPTDTRVLELRVRILRAQKRDAELAPLLTELVTRSSSHEILSYIGHVADEANMRQVQERVLRREAQLEADPQEKLRLGLELAHYLESGGENDAARAEIESIYQANPLIVGVIRSTVDYYWRHDKPRAIRVLAAAAAHADPALKRDYYVETIRKAIDSKQFPDALQSAQQLLVLDPIDSQAIALMADVLSADGRQGELEQLYTAKISEIQQSPLPTAEKTDRIAGMRRGLIPVLERDGKFREAIDQYIEIVNRFPDDVETLTEAGKHATEHNLRPQLIDYYTHTSENSPKDPRWFVVLARLQTQFENYPAAIDAYVKATMARPERQDLAIAEADLEERTFRFADAIRTYSRLYDLSHRTPVWLEHVARLQARLGQNSQAIATLGRAYIDNRPDPAREFSKVATILEELGMTDAAVDFVRQAADLPDGTYVRLMAKARRTDDAIQRALAAETPMPGRELGETVSTYFSPEERQAFATLLTQKRQTANPQQQQGLIDIADSARLYDLEVRWRIDQGLPEYTFEPLQRDRLRFTELAKQLEDLAAKTPEPQQLNLLTSAARSYRAIGAETAELQLFSNHPELQVTNRQRYYKLMASQRPDDLLKIAGSPTSDDSNLLATQALITAGDDIRTIQAIRNQKRDPVWADAYTSLAGLYFGLRSSETSAAFERTLGPSVIQERLGKALDRTRQLAGNIWFYYGQRYGEYLRDLNRPQDADDYLWSIVESRPGDPQAYLELARYYQSVAEAERAVTEFRHALELDNDRPDVHSEIALVLWDEGHHEQALSEWEMGLAQFSNKPNSPAAVRLFRDIRARHQEGPLHDNMDSALKTAARTEEIWQLQPLLQAAFDNSPDTGWLLDVVAASRAPGQLLANLASLGRGSWLSTSQYRVVLENAVGILSASFGQGRALYQQTRNEYLELLLDQGETAAAKRVLDSSSDVERHSVILQQAEIRLAALENRLGDLLSTYQRNPGEGPTDSILQLSAAELSRTGLAGASDQVLEFLYSRQIEKSVNPTAFLGLAEIRVRQGHLAEAMELLKRLNQLSSVPFENLLASARVFSNTGHFTEAQELLKLRVQAVRWDHEARLELARSEAALNQRDAAVSDLTKVVTAKDAPYDIRTEAARELAHSGLTLSVSPGSRELDLLSNRIPLNRNNSDSAYFFAARVAAAESENDAGVRLRMLVEAIAERPADQAIRRNLLKTALEARQYHVALAAYSAMGFGGQNDPEIEADLAEAHQQLGEFSEAIPLFNRAAILERDETRSKALRDRAKQAQSARDKVADNERRHPLMRADMDQPNPVRRRLP